MTEAASHTDELTLPISLVVPIIRKSNSRIRNLVEERGLGRKINGLLELSVSETAHLIKTWPASTSFSDPTVARRAAANAAAKTNAARAALRKQ